MIKLRGYEPKYLHESETENVISGGTMWENNEELYFVNPVTGNEYSIHHTPFEYKDLMLGSPFEIEGQTIFEEDIIEIESLDIKGVVKQNTSLGWFVENIEDKNHFFLDNLLEENAKIVSNTFFENDDFTKN